MYSNIKTLILITAAVFVYSFTLSKENKKGHSILVLEIKSEVNPTLSRYIELGLEEGKDKKYDAIILELNTYGGALYESLHIRNLLIDYPKPIYAFINKHAASAGALIAISCDSIYMSQGATIGAATVVTADGFPASYKFQSYMKGLMRATAEINHRSTTLAEAMVDDLFIIDSVMRKLMKDKRVLTLTTQEAIKYGYCEKKINSIQELMQSMYPENHTLTYFKLSPIDQFVNFCMNPIVSSILILLIIGGIYYELQAPGLGLPLVISIVASALYFIPYYMNGLADYWEIGLLAGGIVLILLEVLVIPGFGIAGITGIVTTFLALALIMLNNYNLDFSFVTSQSILEAIVSISVGFLAIMLLFIIGGNRLPKSKLFKRMALEKKMTTKEGYTSQTLAPELIGKKGTAYTVLRPSGKIRIDHDVYEATTRGEFIDKDDDIIVLSIEGNILKVKKI